MNRMVFVNLPVADVRRSRDYFGGLGFEFDEQFCDGSAACMRINEQAYAMLVARDFFATFTPRAIADATTTEALVCLSAGSREEVDDLVGEALARGGEEPRGATDHGYMYGRTFTDPDGHIWEVMWMDPAVVAGDAAPSAASSA